MATLRPSPATTSAIRSFTKLARRRRISPLPITFSGRSRGRTGQEQPPMRSMQPGPPSSFCRTRHGSDRVARQLRQAGIKAVAIHGGRSQAQRTRAMEDFSRGRVHALVATDVASRGIHVDGVACVVHYDPPEDHKAYVHRSGRTARAGKTGVVVSLVQPEQAKEIRRLQRDVGIDEPITEPDAAKLRDLSPAPTTAAGARQVAEAPTREPKSIGCTTAQGHDRSQQ